jgi:hypothetical protein
MDEPLMPEPHSFEVEIVEKLKSYKSPRYKF